MANVVEEKPARARGTFRLIKATPKTHPFVVDPDFAYPSPPKAPYLGNDISKPDAKDTKIVVANEIFRESKFKIVKGLSLGNVNKKSAPLPTVQPTPDPEKMPSISTLIGPSTNGLPSQSQLNPVEPSIATTPARPSTSAQVPLPPAQAPNTSTQVPLPPAQAPNTSAQVPLPPAQAPTPSARSSTSAKTPSTSARPSTSAKTPSTSAKTSTSAKVPPTSAKTSPNELPLPQDKGVPLVCDKSRYVIIDLLETKPRTNYATGYEEYNVDKYIPIVNDAKNTTQNTAQNQLQKLLEDDSTFTNCNSVIVHVEAYQSGKLVNALKTALAGKSMLNTIIYVEGIYNIMSIDDASVTKIVNMFDTAWDGIVKSYDDNISELSDFIALRKVIFSGYVPGAKLRSQVNNKIFNVIPYHPIRYKDDIKNADNKDKLTGRLWFRLGTKKPIGCGYGRILQKAGTCWFNAILNGFVLGQYSSKIVLKAMNEYLDKNKGKKDLVLKTDISNPSSCPLKSFKNTNDYLFTLAYSILCKKQKLIRKDMDYTKDIAIDVKQLSQTAIDSTNELSFGKAVNTTDNTGYDTTPGVWKLSHKLFNPGTFRFVNQALKPIRSLIIGYKPVFVTKPEKSGRYNQLTWDSSHQVYDKDDIDNHLVWDFDTIKLKVPRNDGSIVTNIGQKQEIKVGDFTVEKYAINFTDKNGKLYTSDIYKSPFTQQDLRIGKQIGNYTVDDVVTTTRYVMFEDHAKAMVGDFDFIVVVLNSDKKLLQRTITVNNKTYALEHATINMEISNSKNTAGSHASGHAVVGMFCGQNPYIYDSGVNEIYSFDWPAGFEGDNEKELAIKVGETWNAGDDSKINGFGYAFYYNTSKTNELNAVKCL